MHYVHFHIGLLDAGEMQPRVQSQKLAKNSQTNSSAHNLDHSREDCDVPYALLELLGSTVLQRRLITVALAHSC